MDVVEMWWLEVAHLVLKALLQIVVATKAVATRAACLRDDDIVISLAAVAARYITSINEVLLRQILLWV